MVSNDFAFFNDMSMKSCFNPLDSYLWGHLKQLVYLADSPDEATLHRSAMKGCETIRHHLGVFERVQSLRFDVCKQEEGISSDSYEQGPDFVDMSYFFPCEIDDGIQYINIGYGAQAPKIVIL